MFGHHCMYISFLTLSLYIYNGSHKCECQANIGNTINIHKFSYLYIRIVFMANILPYFHGHI